MDKKMANFWKNIPEPESERLSLFPEPIIVPSQFSDDDFEALGQRVRSISDLGGLNTEFNQQYLDHFLYLFLFKEQMDIFSVRDVESYLGKEVRNERDNFQDESIIWQWTPWRILDKKSPLYEPEHKDKQGAIAEEPSSIALPDEIGQALNRLRNYVPRDMIYVHVTDYLSKQPHRFASISAHGLQQIVFAYWREEDQYPF